MKVMMKPIEMIAWFKDEYPIPLRYKITSEDDTNTVIKVDKILFKEEEKYAGNRMILYRCQSNINNIQRVFELKYEINTCKWFLYKI
ncbi:hypothetical protein NE686_18240 [Tissierella carlieri]|uniref:Uncharacterized protein n=1 Tax=Tissierella carlieri TaxID=689904 RepID=A0ABT1SEX6_9FIRM|nr:hypothetical protein [Tissierella carlieri]MCQ4925047.1 hypothetical protein [Tissierella carlieri]